MWITTSALLLSLIALIAATLSFGDLANRSAAEAKRQVDLNSRLRQIQSLEIALGDAETGQRGYLLTGRPEYLAPYQEALKQMPSLLASLSDIPVDSGRLQAHLKAIRGLVDLKLGELAQTVELNGSGRHDEALARVVAGAGHRSMEQVRLELHGAMSEIRQDRDAATAKLAASNAKIERFSLASAIVAVVTLALAALQTALLDSSLRKYAGELAQSESRHRTIVEEQQELISLATQEGMLAYVNPAYARHFRESQEALRGRNLFDWVEPADREAVRRQIDLAFETGQPMQGENRMVTLDGREKWVAWTNTVQVGADGQRLLHSVGRDITQRRQAEIALRESEGFLARTGRVGGVGGWEMDVATGAVRWSEQVRRIHEVPLNYQPKPEDAARFHGPEAGRVIENALAQARLHGTPFDLELPLTTAAGRQAWVRTVGEVEADADGRPLRVIGAMQDMSALKQAERKLRELTEIVEHTSDFVVQTDWKGNIQYINPAARRALGLAPEEPVRHRHFSEFNTAQTNQRFADEIAPAVKREGVWIGETTVFFGGGHIRPVSHMVIGHRDAQGRVSRYSAVMRDISREVADRQALRQQTATLASVVEATPAMVAVFDPSLRYLMVNKAWEHWRSKPRNLVIGRTIGEVFGSSEHERTTHWARRALAGETVNFEVDYPSADLGRHVSVSYAPLRMEDGSVGGVIGVAHDITVHREEERRLASLAERDALTGLLNRVGFHAHLARICEADGGAGLALLYIDLDRFKPVNDQHGHAMGDELLHQFAWRLQGLVRPTDAVARLGGDEFAIALSQIRLEANGYAVADKVVEAARRPFEIGSLSLTVSASVGVAFDASGPGGWKALVRRADEAVYQAKAGGRGRYA